MFSAITNFTKTPLHRFWIFSDLQQSDPVNASRCMHEGVEDFLSIGTSVDAVCYLGDSTEGCNLAHLEEMADMQVRELARVDAPVYYVMGNHEFDYHRHVEGPSSLTIPMRDRILHESQWRTTASARDWTMLADFGDLSLLFFSDRCDPSDRTWVTTHCSVHNVDGCDSPGPDIDSDIASARALAESIPNPFFTLSHYAFKGGNRDDEGDLQNRLLPLPQNTLAHFYGHSHVGDSLWGKQNAFRQISTIDNSTITQFDIASLENLRGSAIRSAILEWYGQGAFGVFFRNHTTHSWDKILLENHQR